MQKKVIAAVIGGLLIAPAAFADVTISGRLSVGLENYEVGAGNAAVPNAGGYNAEQLLSDQSSSLVFTGSEDLGGGLKAWFKLDNRFSVPGLATGGVGNFDASGNTQVGLAGGWGTLAIGRADLHYGEGASDSSTAGSLQSWLAPGMFSQVNGTTIAVGSRSQNVVMWDGSFGGGVTARVAYSTAPFTAEGTGVGSNPGKGNATNLAIRWSSGPLNLGASIWDSDTEATAPTTQKSTRLGGGYKFGNISVRLGYDQSSIETAGVKTERTAFIIPVSVAAGAETFHFSYAVADDLEVGGTTTANSGATGVKVGWDHALSKKTVVGVHYTKLDNDRNAAYQLFARALSGTAAATGESVSQLYFGIAHFY